MTHKPAVIGIDGIRELLPHRDPMLMIDEVVTFVAGVSAHARKTVHALEPWAAGHFPGNPVFPGVLLTEAFA